MIDVHFVIAPNSLILDWAGPAEALRMANRRRQELGQPELFRLHFAGPQPDALSSVGAIISQLEPPRSGQYAAAQRFNSWTTKPSIGWWWLGKRGSGWMC